MFHLLTTGWPPMYQPSLLVSGLALKWGVRHGPARVALGSQNAPNFEVDCVLGPGCSPHVVCHTAECSLLVKSVEEAFGQAPPVNGSKLQSSPVRGPSEQVPIQR